MNADPINAGLLCWFISLTACGQFPTVPDNLTAHEAFQRQLATRGAPFVQSGYTSASLGQAGIQNGYPQAGRGFSLADSRADDRVKITQPSQSLILGQPNTLTLQVTGGNLASVMIVEMRTSPTTHQVEAFTNDATHSAVTRLPNGEFSITVVPQHLGGIDLRMLGFFDDHKSTHQHVFVNVIPPSDPPKFFFTGNGFEPHNSWTTLNLSMKHLGGDNVVPNAIYGDAKEPIKIDPIFVNYSVRRQGAGEVIRLSPTSGHMTPVSVGEALVETSFSGRTALTCIVVRDVDYISDTNDNHCQALLRPGEHLTQVPWQTLQKK